MKILKLMVIGAILSSCDSSDSSNSEVVPKENYTSFLQWCEDTSLTDEESKTVEILKTKVGADGCTDANEKLLDIGILILYSTEIRELRPLSTLTHLISLNLSYTEIIDIGPLSSLTKLAEIDLHGTKITNIDPLGSLTDLEKVDITDTDISDISSFSKRVNLRDRLSLSGTKI